MIEPWSLWWAILKVDNKYSIQICRNNDTDLLSIVKPCENPSLAETKEVKKRKSNKGLKDKSLKENAGDKLTEYPEQKKEEVAQGRERACKNSRHKPVRETRQQKPFNQCLQRKYSHSPATDRKRIRS
jgi:hypothetical protein